MLTGPMIILTLKILVAAVTALLLSSLGMLLLKKPRWHGRINIVFFVLTTLTVIGFELLLRLGTDVSSQFSPEARRALEIHLYFAMPSALFLPVMLFTGLKRYRVVHVVLGILFLGLWTGTFITGVIYLPHQG